MDALQNKGRPGIIPSAHECQEATTPGADVRALRHSRSRKLGSAPKLGEDPRSCAATRDSWRLLSAAVWPTPRSVTRLALGRTCADRVFGLAPHPKRTPPRARPRRVRRSLQRRPAPSRHRSRGPDPPTSKARFSDAIRVQRVDRLGGLLHEYSIAV